MKKSKKYIIIIFLLLFFLIFQAKKINVNAQTNYQYNALFDYTCTYIVNTDSTLISSAQNVKEANVYDSHGNEVTLSIIIKTNKQMDNNVINNNSYINSSEIEIQIITNYEDYKLYLYDSFNNEISATGNDYLKIDYLVDDTYYFKAYLSGAGNLIDNRTYETYKTECNFAFTIDTTPPVVKGASLYMDGIFCNSSFKISGFDEGSGIKAIYMLEPNGEKYQNIGTEIELSCSKNGVITFYAIDNMGNRSKLYYIYNDIIKPKGNIKDENGVIINNSYTESNFYYQATDNDSLIAYMEYKKPNSSIFELYDGQIISNTNQSGIYQFRSWDNAGNVSDIKEIYLYKVNSIVEIVHLENSNQVYLTWESDEYDVTINEKQYLKNTIIKNEGTYNVKIENEIGNISYLTFNICCYYKLTKIIQPTCIEEGYTLYNCISCSKEQRKDYTKKTTHIYHLKTIEPTCETEGGLINYCIYCNEMVYINKTNKTPHKFDTYLITVPTCTENGVREFKCILCGYKELKEIGMKKHNFKLLQEEKEGLMITTYNMCEECHTIETHSYKVFENDISSTINKIINSYFHYIVNILLITSSIWSLFIGVKIIISESKEEKDKTKKMIKNYIIGLIIIFIIIVMIPYLVKGIIKIVQ